MDSPTMTTVDDMLAAFGMTENDTDVTETVAEDDQTEVVESEATSENTDTDNETPEEGAETEQQAPAQETPQPKHQSQRTEVNKQNQAFANMRTENAQLRKSVQNIASLLGLDPKQPLGQLLGQLDAQTRNALAKREGVSPELLAKIDALEASNEELVRIKAERKIKDAFDEIKKDFKATDDDIIAFSQQLLDENYNPMAPGADLKMEFLKRNYATFVDRQVKEAVANEQARSASASGASKPDNHKGQDNNTDAKQINTVHDLEDFFASL